MYAGPLRVLLGSRFRWCQLVGWDEWRKAVQLEASGLELRFTEPPWLHHASLHVAYPGTCISVHHGVLDGSARDVLRRLEHAVELARVLQLLPHLVERTSGWRNLEPPDARVRQPRTWRVTNRHGPVLQDYHANVVLNVMPVTILRRQKIARPRIVSTFAERTPHHTAELAGYQDFHALMCLHSLMNSDRTRLPPSLSFQFATTILII